MAHDLRKSRSGPVLTCEHGVLSHQHPRSHAKLALLVQLEHADGPGQVAVEALVAGEVVQG